LAPLWSTSAVGAIDILASPLVRRRTAGGAPRHGGEAALALFGLPYLWVLMLALVYTR